MKPTPQLSLNLAMSIPLFSGVNCPATDRRDVVHPLPCPAGSPEMILGQMVVDDRAFQLGKTTWRNLIDMALSTGHTEMYESDEGEFGLRKPGFRFGPVAVLPEIAVGYVRERLAANAKRRNGKKK